MSRDPYPYNPLSPNTIQRYNYCENSPVNFVDPWGTNPLVWIVVAKAIDIGYDYFKKMFSDYSDRDGKSSFSRTTESTTTTYIDEDGNTTTIMTKTETTTYTDEKGRTTTHTKTTSTTTTTDEDGNIIFESTTTKETTSVSFPTSLFGKVWGGLPCSISSNALLFSTINNLSNSVNTQSINMHTDSSMKSLSGTANFNEINFNW